MTDKSVATLTSLDYNRIDYHRQAKQSIPKSGPGIDIFKMKLYHRSA